MCAALATRHLASTRRRVRIIGAGRVGLYCGLYVAALDGVEEIVFEDLDPDRASATAAACEALADRAVAVRAAGAGTLAGEDVLIIATTSTAGFCGPNDTTAQVVVSLGADTIYQRELDDAWVTAADLFTDSDDSFRVGDLWAWDTAGLVRRHEVGRLVALAGGVRPPRQHDRSVFLSTGSALMDNLAVSCLLRA